MIKWSVVPICIGSASFGAFIKCGMNQNMFFMFWFAAMTIVCVVAWHLLHQAEKAAAVEQEPVPVRTQAQEVRQHYQAPVEQVWNVRDGMVTPRRQTQEHEAHMDFAARAQAIAENLAEGAFQAVHTGAAAYEADPKWGRVVISSVAALVVLIAGALGWLASWKACHLAGALALLSFWLFLHREEKVGEVWRVADENKVIVWLSLSILMFFTCLFHPRWNPLWAVFFAVSGLAATITILKGWGLVGNFLKTVYINQDKPLWSVIAICVTIATLFFGMESFLKSQTPRLPHSFYSIGGMTLAFCAIAAGVAIAKLIWGKKSN